MARSAFSLGTRIAFASGAAAGSDADESAGVLDAIKRLAIHHQIFDERKRGRSEWFDHDGVTVRETAHVGLARCNAPVRAVRFAIDDARAGPADAFAAIVIEGNRLLAVVRELFVHDVEHFEERHVFVQLGRLVGLEATRTVRVFLPPDFESNFHV